MPHEILTDRRKKRPRIFSGVAKVRWREGVSQAHQLTAIIEVSRTSNNRECKPLREALCGKNGTQNIIRDSAARQLNKQIPIRNRKLKKLREGVRRSWRNKITTACRRVTRKVVKDEAERLIRDYGHDAYQIVIERLRAARRRRHKRLQEFLAQVAGEIERRVSKMPPELKRTGKGATSR